MWILYNTQTMIGMGLMHNHDDITYSTDYSAAQLKGDWCIGNDELTAPIGDGFVLNMRVTCGIMLRKLHALHDRENAASIAEAKRIERMRERRLAGATRCVDARVALVRKYVAEHLGAATVYNDKRKMFRRIKICDPRAALVMHRRAIMKLLPADCTFKVIRSSSAYGRANRQQLLAIYMPHAT